MFRFNGCPSETQCMRRKKMVSVLSEGAPRLLRLAQSSDAWNSSTIFAVFREMLKGFPNARSVMSKEFKS